MDIIYELPEKLTDFVPKLDEIGETVQNFPC